MVRLRRAPERICPVALRTIIHGLTLLPVPFITGTAAVAQEKHMEVSMYEGMIASGYVYEGAYLNFTGPNINLTRGRHKVVVGMMPSLRIKQDHGEPRNSMVTPTLGAGLTYCFARLAVQVPLYYTPKTAGENGRWDPGIGLGVRLK